MKGIFESIDEKIVLKADYLEIYIPDDLFKTNIAEEGHKRIRTLGILPVGIFNVDKLTSIKTLACPYAIELEIHTKDKRFVNDLYGESKGCDCVVLSYYKGQSVMNDGIIEDSTNVQSYLNLLMGARVPKSTKYDDVFKLWLECCSVNNKFLGVPSLIMELIVTAAYRNPDDPSKEFAMVAGADPNRSPYSYLTINNRKVVQQTNTFGGLSFEDFNLSSIVAMNHTAKGIKEIETPLEKIIYL